MWVYYMLRIQKYQFMIRLSKFIGMLLCIQSQQNDQAQAIVSIVKLSYTIIQIMLNWFVKLDKVTTKSKKEQKVKDKNEKKIRQIW